MNDLIVSTADSDTTVTMTSREIAELVESRHDSVKRTIETLASKGVIVQPQTVDEQSTDSMGRSRTTAVYVFSGDRGKRDSIVAVAQLSPEFTARLVDRWQELEAKVAAPVAAVVQDPEVARLVALRAGGALSEFACEVAAFHLLGLVHPSEARASEPASAAPAPESQPEEKLPYFLRVEYWQTRSGRRVKPRPKFRGNPKPVKLTDAGRHLLSVDDGLTTGTARDLANCVVGGYFEIRRALYEFNIDTISGFVTASGVQFSAGRQSGGEQAWKAVKLLREISGVK